MSTRLGRLAALSATFAVALGASIAAPGASLAATPACKVTNTTHPATFGKFQRAVNKARSGDRLELRGTCSGPITIGKNLTVVGIKTKATGTPTLTGNDATRVLWIPFDATVTLKTLVIRDGRAEDAPFYPASSGAGILLDGKLTLVSVTVRDNISPHSSAGSGAIEASDKIATPSLTIAGASKLFGNKGGYGGAIEAYGPVTIKGSTRIHHNQALFEGGALAVYSAILTIKGTARIDHNTSGQNGGGINGSDVRISDQVVIDFNEAGGDGGGIFGGLAIDGDAEIRNNTAEGSGGGFYLGGVGVFLCTTAIHDNAPDDCAP